jgi:TfoX/Sxy family transcriptional regulator of competence genes
LGSVTHKPMFSGIGIYHAGVFFAGIWDDALLLRLDETHEDEYFEAGFTSNDPSSKGKNRKRYYIVPGDVLDSRAELERWSRRSIDFIRASAKPKARMKAAKRRKR